MPKKKEALEKASEEIFTVKERVGDSVRSMSGRTKEILGGPKQEWMKC